MATHPYIPLYVDDYDAHTAHLTPAQDGIYGRLLRLAWRTPGCSLPNDEAWIARKVRLSSADWQRIGKPVLDEFFKLQRGRFVQKRLKAEYDDISRRKTARVAAGKKGGEAKARKTHEKPASKATDLLADTHAFHIQNHIQEDNPPSPLSGGEAVSAAFSKAWGAYPEEGRGNHGPDPAWTEWPEAVVVAGGEDRLVAAVERRAAWLAAHPRERAKTFHRWLRDRGFVAYLDAGSGPSARMTWAGPAAVRAAVVEAVGEPFARSWFDDCGWQDLPPAIVTTSRTAAGRLKEALGPLMAERGWQVVERAA